MSAANNNPLRPADMIGFSPDETNDAYAAILRDDVVQ